MRTPRLLAAALLVAAFAAAPARGQETQAPREVFRGERVRVLAAADVTLEEEAAQAIARRAEAAYDFARAALDWSNDARLKRAFTIEVVSREAMQKRYPGALGVTVSPSRFVMAEGYLERSSTADCTLAHELTHIQDRRQLARRRVPIWLIEGRALVVGELYGEKLGLGANRYDRNEARALARITSDDARAVFAARVMEIGETRPKVEEGSGPHRVPMAIAEWTGHLFLEFLRTRWRSGAPDAIVRLTRVHERVAQGEALAAAFEAELGGPLAEAQEEFVALLDRTARDAPERFRGTMWAAFYPAKKPVREPALY